MKATNFDAMMLGYVRDLFAEKWAPLIPFPGRSIPLEAGVYVLAYSSENLTGTQVKPEDVFYVGMSNSLDGVRGATPPIHLLHRRKL